MSLTTQSISAANTNTVVAFDGCNTAMLTNTHATSDLTIKLWVSGTDSGDISATNTLINNSSGILGYATGYSAAMTVDGDSATAAEFLNEKLFKSDGTSIGVCSAVGSTTSLTISGGIETMLADNDNLYVGNRYYILNNMVIPNGGTLKLEGDEINFNTDGYILLVSCDIAGLDIIFRN